MIAHPEPLECGPIRTMLHTMKTRIIRWALRAELRRALKL